MSQGYAPPQPLAALWYKSVHRSVHRLAIWLNVAFRSFLLAQDQLMHPSHLAVGRSIRSRVLLAATIAAFLLVTACSGGEPDTASGDETPDTTAAQSEAADVDAAEREVSEAPDAPLPENESSESAGGAGDVADIDLNADYCDIVEQAEESGLFSGEGPQTPDDLTAAAEQTRQLTEAMVRQAPDDIADDVETASRSLADLLSVLEAHASRTGEVGPAAREDAKVQAAIDAIESKEVQDANDRVDEWQRENC